VYSIVQQSAGRSESSLSLMTAKRIWHGDLVGCAVMQGIPALEIVEFLCTWGDVVLYLYGCKARTKEQTYYVLPVLPTYYLITYVLCMYILPMCRILLQTCLLLAEL
jgi:hypothetical protein